MQRAVLVFNPAAGTRGAERRREAEAIRSVFQDAGVETTMIETPPDLGTAVFEQIEDVFDTVVVCGGDGTVNCLLQAFASGKRRAAIGILPHGSGNLLARQLRMPRGTVEAARALLRAERRPVPIGCIETLPPGPRERRYWLGVAGVGVDAAVFARLGAGTKSRLGIGAYYLSAARHVLFSPRLFTPFTVQWRDDAGGMRSESVTQLFLERIDYFGPCVDQGDCGELGDDRCRAVLFKGGGRASFVSYGVRQVANRLVGLRARMSQVEVVAVQEVTCLPLPGESRTVSAQVDGEPFRTLPLRAWITDLVANVLVPSA